MTFREIFLKILLEQDDENDVTVRESIARGITDKAASGDLSAVKFLREIVDSEQEKDEEIQEIRISVIE